MENPTIEFLLGLLFNLALFAPGAGLLAVVLVNVGKIFKIVKDDFAQVSLNILNVVFAIVIGVLALFFPGVDIPGLDKTFGSLADTLTAFLPLLMMLMRWITPEVYGAMRGVPVLGYHYKKSLAEEKKAMAE